MSAETMTPETEYIISEVHFLLWMQVHPVVIAEQLNRKPASLYKLLHDHGDPAAERFGEARVADRTPYTREQLDRRARQARERETKRRQAA